jgi:hypothetical protein
MIKKYKTLIVVLQIAFVYLYSSFSINAQEPLPSKTEPPAYVIPHKQAPCEWDTNRCNRDGIFMDEIITYKIRDVIYKVPAIYLTGWISNTYVGKIIDIDAIFADRKNENFGVTFQFWMPRLRPEEIKTFSISFLIPNIMKKAREIRRGSKEPDPDEYPVLVEHAKFTAPDDPDILLPEQMFKNVSETYNYIHKKQADEQIEPELNLKRVFWRQHWDSSLRYYNLPNSNIQVTMTCSSNENPDINPLCKSYVYFNKEQLSFTVTFPKPKLFEWHSIVMSVHDLMVMWRQK